MKTFSGDLDFFYNKLLNNEKFALSRWGDGELIIIRGLFLDLLDKGNGEFKFDPNDSIYSESRRLLQEAYVYKDSQYYVGIPCRCCVGKRSARHFKRLCGSEESQLTWANIFVNSNYRIFEDKIVPLLWKLKTRIYANINSCRTDMVSDSVEIYPIINRDAWLTNLSLIDEIKKEISESNLTDTVFLFAAGPFANILVYELWKFNKQNTYIDVGSVFDKYLGLKLTRDYQFGGQDSKKVCVW